MRINTKLSRALLACGVAYGALIAAGAAAAQTTGSGSAAAPATEEIVVTANKRAEKLHDVAMGITAVSGEDLQTRQELDLQDFAAQVPGFTINQINAGWNREILRGQNSGGAGATVATSIDEFPLSFSGSDSNASLTSTNPDTYDLQRIEVLKGPQGDLYGAAAEGGIVKYITNGPNLYAYQAGAEAGVINVDHGQTGASAKGFVNLPLMDGKLALRITGYDEDIPGYISDPLYGRNTANSGYRYGARISLLYKPTNDLSIRLTAFDQGLKDRDDNEAEVVGAPFDPTTTSSAQFKLANGGKWEDNTAVGSNTRNSLYLYGADIEYDLHWAKLSSLTSYGEVKNSFLNDYDNLVYETIPPSTIITYLEALGSFGYPTTGATFVQHQTESVNKYNQEFRLSSEPGLKLVGLPIDWQLGMFLTREDVVFDQFFDVQSLSPPYQYLSSPLTGGRVGGAALPSRYEEAAIFGQADYHLTSKFDVAVGFRDTYDTETSQITLTCCLLEGPAAELPRITSYEDAATFSVAPRYKLDDNTTIYARFATGHRPGGPNLLIPGAPADFPFTYKSDSTDNYEAGVRTYLFGKTVSVDVDAFYIDWSQIQILQTFTSTLNGQKFNVTGNAGSATSHGVEYNFSWTPIHGLTLGLLGAYTESYLTQGAPALNAGKGTSLAYVPKWRNTINADYDWTVIDDYKAYVGGTVVFTDSVFSDLGDYPGAHIKLPSYTTLDLHAGIRKGPYSVEIYAKNLTNAMGVLYYSYNGGYDGTGLANFITPRTVGMRIGAKF